MTNKVFIVYLTILAAFSSSELKASDWKTLVNLKGRWQFTVGDNPDWASPAADTRDWDVIEAPRDWEHYYEGYNGYAWYRKNFGLTELPKTEMVDLFLGYIDDVDEVFINGHKVGQTGQFFPNYESAYDQERHYLVPVSILNTSKNVIAIRVFDEGLEGGILRADKFGFYFDRDQEGMAVDLTGMWKFSIDNFGDMNSPQTSDEQWDEIYVPMNWESQGYPDFNGTAWYRKRFTLPESLKGEELYLVLGKIDDYDDVYLNGYKIGEVEELDSYSRFQRSNAWALYRIYKIPSNFLRSKNLLSVEVEDESQFGGIYEGPIGIMKAQDVRDFREKVRWQEQNSGWNSFFQDLIRLFD
ncbi:sugar-binding domain-containing protein [Sunxiuqinia sp. sy24]|uniref:sugar-binding domain-containing protein n=1 Tax=Sunxiuqinia sp. sy24 TaxID=3461495 RepID=UPI00404661E8